MQIGTNPDYERTFAAVLDWWRDAGIDSAFDDAPRSWLPDTAQKVDRPGSPQPRSATSKTAEIELLPVAEPASLPQDLEALRSWWLSSPSLDDGRVHGRVAPRGGDEPELMIIAPTPETSDREQLLSGPEGKLLDLFLAQAGMAEDAVYRASVMPSHSLNADWTSGASRYLAEVLQHHIQLVRPKRLLVLGSHISTLLGHASTQGPAVLSVFNHEGGSVPMLAVRRIPALAAQPRWKCILWQAWLDWTG